MARVFATGGVMNGRSFRDREREALLHRSCLKAKEWFGKRLRDEWTRDMVKAELEKLPEKEREIVRKELNRLNSEYQVRQV